MKECHNIAIIGRHCRPYNLFSRWKSVGRPRSGSNRNWNNVNVYQYGHNTPMAAYCQALNNMYRTNCALHYFVLYVDHQTMYSEYCSKQFSEWMKWPLVQCQSCTHWLLYIYIVKTAIPIEANETLQQSEGTKIGQNMVNTFHKTICCSTWTVQHTNNLYSWTRQPTIKWNWWKRLNTGNGCTKPMLG